MTSIARVGKNGEIVLRKPEMKIAGIKPGDKVVIIGHPRGIIIKKIPSLRSILEQKSVIKLTLDEVRELWREIRKEIDTS